MSFHIIRIRKYAPVMQFIGWFLFIIGIISLIKQISNLKSWNSIKDNYFKQYVYSEYGTLYYEASGKRIYLQKIYNTDHKKIPNNQTVLMYINKDNINEGIYFDLNDSVDNNIINPLAGILMGLFITLLGFFLIQDSSELKKGKYTTKPGFLLSLFFFVGGIAIIVFQIHNMITYSNLKSQNNTATATIYSQIFNKEATDTYKPVAYYYVDGEKYIYVNKYYEKGTLNNVLGDTFEVYYDKSDPNKAIKNGDKFNHLALILGIVSTLLSFPFIFLRHKMDKRLKIFLENVNEHYPEWKNGRYN